MIPTPSRVSALIQIAKVTPRRPQAGPLAI